MLDSWPKADTLICDGRQRENQRIKTEDDRG